MALVGILFVSCFYLFFRTVTTFTFSCGEEYSLYRHKDLCCKVVKIIVVNKNNDCIVIGVSQMFHFEI